MSTIGTKQLYYAYLPKSQGKTEINMLIEDRNIGSGINHLYSPVC